MFPAFAHFRRTATTDAELGGCPIRKGDKVVMWYASSNRDGSRYPGPDRFDVRRNPDHQAFGAGGRHFCLGAALARLELRILFEETLKRPADDARRSAGDGRVGVHQPAQDAAGTTIPGPRAHRQRTVQIGAIRDSWRQPPNDPQPVSRC